MWTWNKKLSIWYMNSSCLDFVTKILKTPMKYIPHQRKKQRPKFEKMENLSKIFSTFHLKVRRKALLPQQCKRLDAWPFREPKSHRTMHNRTFFNLILLQIRRGPYNFWVLCERFWTNSAVVKHENIFCGFGYHRIECWVLQFVAKK